MKILTGTDLSPNIQKFLPLIEDNSLFYKQYWKTLPVTMYWGQLLKEGKIISYYSKSLVWVAIEPNTYGKCAEVIKRKGFATGHLNWGDNNPIGMASCIYWLE